MLGLVKALWILLIWSVVEALGIVCFGSGFRDCEVWAKGVKHAGLLLRRFKV